MNKKERRAIAAKKAQQKRIITISICALIVLLAVALLVFHSVQKGKARIYSNGIQTITLHDKGSFSAELAHETKDGTYTDYEADGAIKVVFVSNGESVEGSIENDVLTIPEEWQDDHGHGSELNLK